MDSKKRIIAAALAGVMTLGTAGAVLATASVAQAAARPHDGNGSNEYSRRMHEEDVTHRMNVSAIRYEFRKDGDKKKHDRALQKEQECHDKVVRQIKSDYESHARHQKHHHR